MNPLPFRLTPFPVAGGGPAISIGGSIARRADILSFHCELRGDRSGLSIPAPAASPERRERLWEGTCFELFVAAGGSDGYWEFNLSPAGHWDVYRFAGYRKGMRREPAFPSLPFDVRAGRDTLGLKLSLDIGKIVPAGAPVAVGVAAVVETTAGRATFWALSHDGPRPDFHRREGFRLAV